MRAPRAYVAGFGTAGSLLAGAALLFVLASAVVAFRGWPQLNDQAAPAALVVPASSAPHVGADRTTVDRLTFARLALGAGAVNPGAPAVAGAPTARAARSR